MHYDYQTMGVCPAELSFELGEDNTVTDVRFKGGCNGNLKAIGKLLEGKDAQYIIDTLKGNTCGFKQTSCADQLARALEAATTGKLAA
jgi:uncharacterized protein (TIGR03905 family)